MKIFRNIYAQYIQISIAILKIELEIQTLWKLWNRSLNARQN